ncbi:hypothetical protein [Nocardiopsis alba]|uniref:hypothetical protein n=1 Tax=Nocardiopsis alba TaxID=53437 RepID=UPI003D75558D
MADETHGTALPWAAFALGAAGSLAANLLDAVDAVQDAANGVPVDWPEMAAALFFATLVPVALLLVVEMLIRSGKDRDGLAAVMWIGAALVAAGAAIMSMGHMFKVMISLGQPPLFAALMPLAVDGLMLVASVALARAGRAASVPVESVPAVAVAPAPEAAPEAEAEAAPVVPASVPDDVPPVPEAAPRKRKASAPVRNIGSAGALNAVADAFIRSALEAGRTPTGAAVVAAVADHGKRSDRWGRLRVEAVRAELAERSAAPA